MSLSAWSLSTRSHAKHKRLTRPIDLEVPDVARLAFADIGVELQRQSSVCRFDTPLGCAGADAEDSSQIVWCRRSSCRSAYTFVVTSPQVVPCRHLWSLLEGRTAADVQDLCKVRMPS